LRLRWFALYVSDPVVFEQCFGTTAQVGELYRVYAREDGMVTKTIPNQGLERIELDGEPKGNTHVWNPKKCRFVAKNAFRRFVERFKV
jgi:hypothetical protein